MAKFTDAERREWKVPVTVGSIKRCIDLVDVDLTKVLDEDGELLAKLAYDPITLCNVLYALCKPQCDQAGVTDEEFGEGLAGQPIDDAAAALMEALADFSPGPRRRAVQQAVKKLTEVVARNEKKVKANLEDPRLEEAIENALNEEQKGRMEKALAMLSKSGSSSTSSSALPA